MSARTIATTRQALADHVAGATTATLATSLLRLDDMPATDATRRAGAAVVDVLAKRHLEVLAALEAWSADLDSDLALVDVVILALPIEALR